MTLYIYIYGFVPLVLTKVYEKILILFKLIAKATFHIFI